MRPTTTVLFAAAFLGCKPDGQPNSPPVASGAMARQSGPSKPIPARHGMLTACPSLAMGPSDPRLPKLAVDTDLAPIRGAVIEVPPEGNLQAALDLASPSDHLVLTAGATYRGNFTLPAKEGEGWVVIRTSATNSLPGDGVRVSAANEAAMPILETPNPRPVVRTLQGAHHYRFVGIQFRPAAGKDVDDLIVLGSGSESRASRLAHHITFDRCIVRGDPKVGGKRGLQLNAASVAVINSRFVDWKRTSQDTQAMAGWNTPGPFKIVNNYIEASGENIMFGGADSVIADVVPSDIEICGNHFNKPLAWQQGRPEYEGTHWMVKNLLELKVGRRVLVAGNLFEHCWVDAQVGFAIMLQSRNQDGGQPWAVTEHVTFAYNVVRETNNGINVSRSSDGARDTNHIRILGNLLYDIGGEAWGGSGILYQILDGVTPLTIEHNTGFGKGKCIMFDASPQRDLLFRSNVCGPTTYGIYGSGKGSGAKALRHYAPGAVVAQNVILGADAAQYPAKNFFPSSLDDVGFVDSAGRDYRLRSSSPYAAAAHDGTAVGADFERLARAFAAGEPEQKPAGK